VYDFVLTEKWQELYLVGVLLEKGEAKQYNRKFSPAAAQPQRKQTNCLEEHK
jgi:hypothetical protein